MINNLDLTIDSGNIKDVLNDISFSDDLGWNNDSLKKLYGFSSWSLQLPNHKYITLSTPPDINYTPQWRLDWYINDEIKKEIDNKIEPFEKGERVAFKVPVKVHERDKNPNNAWFKVFLERDENLKNSESQIIRDGITITGIRPSRKKDLRALLVVDDPQLTNLLGDAENPAHTEWQTNSRNFKGKYIDGAKVISFVTRSIDILYELLIKPSEGIDRESLKDIFNIDIDESETEDDSPTDDNEDNDNIDTPPPPPPRNPKKILVQQLNNGFKLIPGNANSFPKKSKVSIAYRIPNKNPLKKYDPKDFVISEDIKVEKTGIAISELGNNFIKFSIKQPDFEMKLTGFDPNRDLYIKVT